MSSTLVPPLPVDPNEEIMLQRLARIARGEATQIGAHGTLPTEEEKLAAAAQYLEIKKAKAAREAAALAAQQQGHAQHIEEERIRVEDRRVDAEFERIQVQKADVIVRAIEAAARNPEIAELVGVAKGLSERLLSGTTLPAIEDKSGDG